jgi:hypothetical protein
MACIDLDDVTRVKTADRDIGMVCQDPALFGNRNVRPNVSFPLETQKRDVEEIAERVNAEVRSMHIEHLLGRLTRSVVPKETAGSDCALENSNRHASSHHREGDISVLREGQCDGEQDDGLGSLDQPGRHRDTRLLAARSFAAFLK